jgi:hypothetical protein
MASGAMAGSPGGYLGAQQFGSGSTFVAGPLANRKSGEWYYWGYDFAPAALAVEVPGGTGISGSASVSGLMMAIPGYFPEAGTITALATGLITDQNGLRATLGICRDDTFGTNHYPVAGVPPAIASVTGAGTGLRKIRGGVVSFPTLGNEILWYVLQDLGGFGAGSIYIANDRRNFFPAFGISNMVGLALNSTLPGSLDDASGMGWYTTAAPAQGLAVGGFPRTSVGTLSGLNNLVMWGNFGMPIPLFQWTRT